MESLREFFRERFSRAQKRQNIYLKEITQFYIVNLLSDFLSAEKLHQSVAGTKGDEPLAIQYTKALTTPNYNEQYLRFKTIGDRSLYVTGFFGDSLKRKVVDVDYYIAIGERAYGEVSSMAKDQRWGKEAFAEIFDELANKFTRLVDVISEISESTGVTSNSDLLRLYERWLMTKSDRLSERLREQGIVPTDTKKEPIH